MSNKILVGLLLVMLIPTWLFAGVTGKISGYVKDEDTGDALPGVNVVIDGTMMGAVSDINGFYIAFLIYSPFDQYLAAGLNLFVNFFYLLLFFR